MGTAADPYIITDAMQLYQVRNLLTSHFKLGNDIDLSMVNWTPIGDGSGAKAFKGTFDGNGKTIQGLTINSNVLYTGLFGYLSGATVKNLTITGADVKSTKNNTGILAGYTANKSTIENVGVSGSVEGTQYAGGLVGYNNSTSITNAYATGSVTGSDYTGGLAGGPIVQRLPMLLRLVM